MPHVDKSFKLATKKPWNPVSYLQHIFFIIVHIFSMFFISHVCSMVFISHVCSMVAEIGGYSGLLLGFSLMDTVAVFSHITKWMFAPAE